MSEVKEIQLDGLIGPTHFFGGLGSGNVASLSSAGRVSSPRAAALQGLQKMKAVHDLGVMQLVMPPHPRPALGLLRNMGFSGTCERVISQVSKEAPEILPVIYSSSAMWAANAATVCASAESADGKVHLTPANLISNAHRALEAGFTAPLLRRIFHGEVFCHHAPLAANPLLADEGAANHMRLAPLGGGKAVHVFVYGVSSAKASTTKKYQARQQLQASQSIARIHQLEPARTVFLQQHPDAIDAGVFHNDVIATNNGHALFYHEQAFLDDAPLAAMSKADGFLLFKVNAAEMSIADAVKSYLFNSQILTLDDGRVMILAPAECKASDAARRIIESWVAAPENPIAAVQYIDVGQSMGNGGGPACLRLRLWLNAAEQQMMHSGVVFSDALFERLGNWILMHYAESLSTEDLKNPELAARVQKALLELESIVDLKGLYSDDF